MGGFHLLMREKIGVQGEVGVFKMHQNNKQPAVDNPLMNFKIALVNSKRFCYKNKILAPIAQMDRVTDYESAGRPFESGWARQ
jgi:hypothetical protein